MKLNKDQKEKLINSLKSFGRIESCVICKANDWSAADTIFELREFNEGDIILGKGQSIYPVIPITCGKCGNTHFLNALKFGIIPSENKEGK